MSEKINTDHFSTMEDLLEHLKKWERDDDIDAYYRFFSPSCAFELANKIEKQQKLINIFIHNEAVREGKDFNEIKEKYYECL
jgi:hypothetical protein